MALSSEATSWMLSRIKYHNRDYYVHTLWGECAFEVYLTDGRTVWHGQVDREYIEEELKPESMDMDVYMNLVREALGPQNAPSPFTYSFCNTGQRNEIKMVWKRHVEAGISIQSYVYLKKVDDSRPTIQRIFNLLMEKNSFLSQENEQLKRLNRILDSQKNEGARQLEKMIADKQVLELSLYSKFVELLNQKKRKIRELKEKVKQNLGKVACDSSPSSHPAKVRSCHHSNLLQRPDLALETGLGSQADALQASLGAPTPSLGLLTTSASQFKPTVRKRIRHWDDSNLESSGAKRIKVSIEDSSLRSSNVEQSIRHMNPQDEQFSEVTKNAYKQSGFTLSIDEGGGLDDDFLSSESQAHHRVHPPTQDTSQIVVGNAPAAVFHTKRHAEGSADDAQQLFDVMSF